jgi:hypothetical protein
VCVCVCVCVSVVLAILPTSHICSVTRIGMSFCALQREKPAFTLALLTFPRCSPLANASRLPAAPHEVLRAATARALHAIAVALASGSTSNAKRAVAGPESASAAKTADLPKALPGALLRIVSRFLSTPTHLRLAAAAGRCATPCWAKRPRCLMTSRLRSLRSTCRVCDTLC